MARMRRDRQAAHTPSLTDAQAAPERLVIDVTIKSGEVTPTNAQFRAAVKQPIVIRVTATAPTNCMCTRRRSTASTSAPDPAQSYQFTVDMPGRVDVELHNLNKTVATIQVQ